MANVIEEITIDEVIPFRIHKVLITAAGLIKDINMDLIKLFLFIRELPCQTEIEIRLSGNVSFPGLIIFPNELFQCLV